MILSFKKVDSLLLYLSLKGVNFMNSQHLRLKWHFEKLDKYGPMSHFSVLSIQIPVFELFCLCKLFFCIFRPDGKVKRRNIVKPEEKSLESSKITNYFLKKISEKSFTCT